MEVNKLHSVIHCQVDIVKMNRPGIYFLFDDHKKLIYIGESKFPLIRIMDHFWKHYKIKKIGNRHRQGFQQKGIGPVFAYFKIIQVQSEDSRVRQHYEKRWIRKYSPELNYNTKHLGYDLTWKEFQGFVRVYESFFKNDMTWHQYLNDEVLRQRPMFRELKAERRRRRYLATGR